MAASAQPSTSASQWFTGANGRAVLPRWPRDSCTRLPQDGRAALAALTWTTTAAVRIKQLTEDEVSVCDSDRMAKPVVVSATPSQNTVRFYLGRGYAPLAHPLAELYAEDEVRPSAGCVMRLQETWL